MERRLEQIGHQITIKKPDRVESLGIVMEQSKNPKRTVTCVFDSGNEFEYRRTVNPYLHLKNNMEAEVSELVTDMEQSDFIIITDLTLEPIK